MTSGQSTPSKEERIIWVGNRADLTKTRGLQGVNLIIDWRDIEPSKGVIDFSTMDRMIVEVKSRGLYLILRIYANAGGHHQAWPDWVTPDAVYVSSEGPKHPINILPWDSKYRTAFKEFQQKLYAHFIETNIQPDGIQLILGGNYGEQVLGDFLPFRNVDDNTFDSLIAAEKDHIDAYVNTVGEVLNDHIVMVNSLRPKDLAREDEVGLYARSFGISWIQSNAGACSLKFSSYGDDSMKMLSRFKSGGAKILLEDETTQSCPVNKKDLTSRVLLMQELQSTHGFSFDAVNIDAVDDLNDTAGISALKKMLYL